MSVRTRVGRLEGRLVGLSICPVCRRQGKEAVRVEWDPLIPVQCYTPCSTLVCDQ